MDNENEDKKMFMAEMTVEQVLEFTSSLLEIILNNNKRLHSIATVQNNVSILEVLLDTSKNIEDLFLSYMHYLKDSQDDREDIKHRIFRDEYSEN